MRKLLATMLGLIMLTLALNCTSPPRASSTETSALTPAEAGLYLTDAPDRDLFSLIQRLRPNAEQPVSWVVNPEPISYETGRQDVFWVADLVDNEMYQVEATLLYVSEHAYWYFEKGFEPGEDALAAAAQTFEDVIYPTVTEAFGMEWTPEVDNNPHMSILHTPLRGVAGYYSASDEYPKEIYSFSNERKMFYMNTRSFSVGSVSYLGTLAHELQHAVHWVGDSGEETWINEGLSEVAKDLAGYGLSFIDYFISSPATALTAWPSSGGSTLPHYGAASLFMKYLAQHYGNDGNLSGLVARQEDGVKGITAYLQSSGYDVTFLEVFGDWLVANYLDSLEFGVYFYTGLDISIGLAATIREPGLHNGSVPQYSGEYIEVRLESGDAVVSFQGQTETPLLPVSAHSGSYCWWGNRGNAIDSTLTASIDLSQVSQATLNFWAWYAIEESWDYAYVEVSADGGKTWDILEGGLAAPENPLGLSFGPGYTGQSAGWQQDSADLTPYAGMEVILRFEYVTDDAVNDDGICIDDISIPETGYFDDAESEGLWDALGFIRTDNRVPQSYLVQVIELGNEVTLREMLLDQDGNGSLVLRGFGAELERAIVIIAPIAPKTSQASSYVLSVEPVP